MEFEIFVNEIENVETKLLTYEKHVKHVKKMYEHVQHFAETENKKKQKIVKTVLLI
jgi:ABC-type polysaccharide/polyol phosphate transport system ATPase subunit